MQLQNPASHSSPNLSKSDLADNASVNLANLYSYAAMNNILMATSSLPSLAETSTYPLTGTTTTTSASSLTSNSSLNSLRPNASPLAYLAQSETPLNLCKGAEYPYPMAKYSNQSLKATTTSNSSLPATHLANTQPSAHKLKSGSSSMINASRRQRERTTFDPQEELPRLIQIFERTHHPTRYQISSICEELNALNSRKGKKPLEPYNIQYWFKNARAALRRRSKTEHNLSDEYVQQLDLSQTAPNRMGLSRLSAAHSRSSSSSNGLKGAKKEFFDDEGDYDDDEKYDEDFDDAYDDFGAHFDASFKKHEAERQEPVEKMCDEEKLNYRKLDSSLNSSCDENDELVDDSYDDDELDCDAEIDVEVSDGANEAVAFADKQFKAKKFLDTGAKNASRRNRIFIDPVSEVPILEEYFKQETYPDHYMIEKICDALNQGEYRHKYPKLEARNIQLWFKNHRAKLKRLKFPIKGEDELREKSEPCDKDESIAKKSTSSCSTYASSLSTVSSNVVLETIGERQQHSVKV